MIIGIGCDIIEHATAINLNWEFDSSIQKRIFSPEELQVYAQKKTLEFLAGRFAAKEAILKCLGTGMQDGIALTDIQILQSQDGIPIIQLDRGPKEISDLKEINFWHISISHSSKYSMALVIAEKQ